MSALAWQADVERLLGAAGPARWMQRGPSGWGETWSLDVGAARYFVKTATGRYAPMLEAEADGLRALAATDTIRVPRVVANVRCDATGALALEWLEMRSRRNGADLGRALAAQHQAAVPCGSGNGRFGWSHDNWIGGTPQKNGWDSEWPRFFRDRRLAPLFALAEKNGHGGALQRDAERLLDALPGLLRGHEPAPSLLHGDLWSGNAAVLANGEPVVFDPAVYAGDREADVAMTELFGGFDADFYAAYNEVWPLDAGYPVRRKLYNLYHLLNHLNLFGASYLGQVEWTIGALLAEAR